MSGRVHLAVEADNGRTSFVACGAGARWSSATLTSTRGTRLVTCRACQRTSHWRRAVEKILSGQG